MDRQKLKINRLQHSLADCESSLKKLKLEREWLIGEINHRVKNNLQIISSLLSNQSAYLTNQDAKATLVNTQRRLYAISMVYQILYRSDNLAQVNLHQYVSDLMTYLKDEYPTGNILFKIAVADVNLGVNLAIPLGLIINEAVSNAVKYAFPESSEGEICVEVIRGDGEILILSISDNGVGLPPEFNPEIASSLGTSLIIGLSKQLGGELSLKDKNGLSITLKFVNLNQEIINRYLDLE